MEWSSTSLRLIRAVAETGSFTAAAAALGYTQSAVSRQVAGLERAAAAMLFERRPGGVRLTPAGATLLRHGSVALDEVDRAVRLLHATEPAGGSVRLGMFTSLGAALAPEVLTLMRQHAPDVEVLTREGSTPALVKSLRAATVDLALISSRPPYPPPDDQDPPLAAEVLLEGDLLVAVPADGALGRGGSVTLAELQDAIWITGPQTAGETGLGVWPALARRPSIGHQASDWLTKLALVAGGWGITTMPSYLVGLAPDGVRLVRVADGAPVTRRVLLAARPGEATPAAIGLADRIREAAARLAIP